jgi:hypothetical protein
VEQSSLTFTPAELFKRKRHSFAAIVTLLPRIQPPQNKQEARKSEFQQVSSARKLATELCDLRTGVVW